MIKNSFTIFGQGFVGTNISIFLKKKKYNLFLPKKGKYKFKKNLHNVIYCIGNQNWLKDPKVTYDANLGLVPEIIFNNKFDSFTLLSSTRLYLVRFILEPGLKSGSLTCTVNTSNVKNYQKNNNLSFKSKFILKNFFFKKNKYSVKYDTIQSHEGGRFYQSQIRYMIIQLNDQQKIKIDKNYK